MTTVTIKNVTHYTLHSDNPTLTFGTGTDIDGTTKGSGVYGIASIDWSITNLGSISGSSAFALLGDATLVNGVNGKISNTSGIYSCIYIGETGHVTNGGSIVGSGTGSGGPDGGISAVYLKGGGTIVNQLAGKIVGNISLGATGTITNKGSVSNSGIYLSAISLSNGGAVTNSGHVSVTGLHASDISSNIGGTITNTGKLTGSAVHMSGIELEAGGSVINKGTIDLSTTQHVAGIELGAGGTVDNTGKIDVSSSEYHAAGVELISGGAITNSGSIIVSTPAFGVGVELENGGTLDNLAGGSITASGLVAVYAKGAKGVQITNAGTISGGNSIVFANAGAITNTLTLESGSDLIGAAVGSTATGATNALVLKGTGTANNAFDAFNTLVVDKGASWTLGGSSGIGKTTVNGALTVTGSLTTALTLNSGDATFKSAFGGDVTFKGTDELELSKSYGGTISGFGTGDKIDFIDFVYAAGDKAVVSGHTVNIETSADKTKFSFEVSGTYTSGDFSVGKDASDHILVTGVHAALADLGGSIAGPRSWGPG